MRQNVHPSAHLRGAVVIGLRAVLLLAVAAGLSPRRAAGDSLTPAVALGNWKVGAQSAHCTGTCATGTWTLVTDGLTPIETTITGLASGVDVLVDTSFVQTDSGGTNFAAGHYRLKCTGGCETTYAPDGGSTAESVSPVSEVVYYWEKNQPAMGGLSFLFRTTGTAPISATFRLETRATGPGYAYDISNINFVALPLVASPTGSPNGRLTQTPGSVNLDWWEYSISGATHVSQMVLPVGGTQVRGATLTANTNNDRSLAVLALVPVGTPPVASAPLANGQTIWVMGADSLPGDPDTSSVTMFNGVFPLDSGSATNYHMYANAPNGISNVPCDTVGSPTPCIQIRDYPTDLSRVLFSAAYSGNGGGNNSTTPWGFLKNPKSTTNAPLEVKVTTPNLSGNISEIVYSFNATVTQHCTQTAPPIPGAALCPSSLEPWRVGEFRVFYQQGSGPWTAAPHDSYNYWKTTDGAKLITGTTTYLGDVGPVQIWGRLKQVTPNTTYTFRIVADYQAYNDNGNGVSIQGASLLAFNTGFTGGVFRALMASGRFYNNGANSVNYSDYCTSGCWGIGSPAEWKTDPFLPMIRSGTGPSMVGFGSIYGWGSKAPGAATVGNFGIAVGDYKAPNTSSFGIPENRWETTNAGFLLEGTRAYQGSFGKNCMQNGIARGCDASPGMTNGVIPGSYFAVTTPAPPAPGSQPWAQGFFWGGLTNSLTGQKAGISGDLVLFDVNSHPPTWASPAGVRGVVTGGRTLISWTTSGESGSASFRMEKVDPSTGQLVKVGPAVSAFPPWPYGATYEVEDPTALAGQTYSYRIVETEFTGSETIHGPFSVTISNSASATSASPRAMAPAVAGGYSNRVLTPRSSTPANRPGFGTANLPWSRSSFKTFVQNEGIYSISLDGNDVSRDHSMSSLGRNVDFVNDGSNKRLLFYGTPLRTQHTDRNAYLLKPGGPSFMKEVNGKGPAAAAQPPSFPYTLHVEQDEFPAYSYVMDEGRDFWLWKHLNTWFPSASMLATVRSLSTAASGTATITFSLYNSNDTPGVVDLLLQVAINGTLVPASVPVDGPADQKAAFSFPASLLKEGANEISVYATFDSAATSPLCWVDSFDLTFPRRYEAYQNEARVRSAGQQVVTVSGFTQDNILVFDVTTPLNPVYVKAVTVKKDASGYSYSFASGKAAEFYLGPVHTASLQSLVDGGLATRNPGSRHLVIAPYDLLTAAQALSTYRASTGLSSMAVPVEAIWDEFGFGLPSPDAIKAFLNYTQTRWNQAPSYVVIAGKGTFDENNLWGGNDNLIPTNFKATALGLAGTDTPYVAGTAMSIGRISVTSGTELAQFTAKLSAHESHSPTYAATFLAGSPGAAGNFPLDMKSLAAGVPSGYSVTTADLQSMNLGQVRTEAFGAFERGDDLLVWVGHGGMDRIDSDGVLTTDDIASLPVAQRLPLFAGATCNVNAFFLTGWASLGERMVARGTGGALASWAAVRASFNEVSVPMVRELETSYFAGRAKSLRLGDVVRSVQGSNGGDKSSEFLIWQLLGDPGSMVP